MINVAFTTMYLSRKSGGVIEVVEGLSNALLNNGYTFPAIFGVNDPQGSKIVSFNAPVYSSDYIGPRAIAYSNKMTKQLYSFRPNIVHSHGLWMHFSKVSFDYCLKNNIKSIISPHGMLDSWALNNSSFKKKIALWLFERRHLLNSSCIHALNESEYNSIRALNIKAPIAIIPNGINTSTETDLPYPFPEKCLNNKVLLFLGRLHPKKGLEELITAFNLSMLPNNNWKLIIAGWSSNDYQSHLENCAKDSLNKHIFFIGSVFDNKKFSCYMHANAFILPSFSEGLPMTVLEALSYKVPAFITNECNLNNLIEENAAIRISNSIPKLTKDLNAILSLPELELKNVAMNGFNYSQNYTWISIANKFDLLYQWLLNNESKPNFIYFN